MGLFEIFVLACVLGMGIYYIYSIKKQDKEYGWLDDIKKSSK